jgi:hypothetical protein
MNTTNNLVFFGTAVAAAVGAFLGYSIHAILHSKPVNALGWWQQNWPVAIAAGVIAGIIGAVCASKTHV